MNLGFRQIFAILAGLCFAINVPAQDMPVLPADPAVLKGVMPNGMAYYLVTNPDEKGVADFALVQKTGLKTVRDEEGRVLAAAEGALDSLKRVDIRKYFSNHEIIPDKEGIIEVTDDATVFRFNNVRLDVGVNVMDSTLLMIMDIADRASYVDDEFINKWYAPADQAVIVSGDIDSKSLVSKLIYMSYMTPFKVSEQRPEYVREAEGHNMSVAERNGFAEVSGIWVSDRIPQEYMNTVQPEILEMSFNTLGDAAAGRIRASLKNKDVPVADVSYSHVCSSEYPYEDSFAVHVVVGAEDVGKARESISAVMTSIDSKGLMTNEYIMSEASYLHRLGYEADRPLRSNHEFVDRCRNAFLYNSSLASAKEKLDFHTSRNLPDTMRQRLFNGIASAVIDTVELSSVVPSEPYADIVIPDTLSSPVAPVKLKIKSSRREPVSGGTIWTFSNGIKVVYKKVASERMYYALALNGGYSDVAGLNPGEGAFVGDHFKSYRICGMESSDFMRLLGKEGITMDVTVNLSNMLLDGSIPKRKIPVLLRSLLAVANERTSGSRRDFEYHRACEYLALDYAQGSFMARMTAIDSIMCPGYTYSPYKVKGRMSDDFPEKAGDFYDRQFSKVNDGVLVLVGNVDEEDLKKTLIEYLGHFRTAEGVSKKPVVRYQPVTGWSTYTVDGDSDNVDVAISARMPLTMDNYVAAGLAAMVVNREIAQKLNGSDCKYQFTYNCRIYPEERINAMISMSSASLDDLSAVRTVLNELTSMELSDADLKPYKEALKDHVAKEMKSPEYWVHAIVLRYLDGKDMSTKYASKTDAVTTERVKSILALLDEGCKVEYVTIKK